MDKKEILKGVLQSLMDQLDEADSAQIMMVAKKKKPIEKEEEYDEEDELIPSRKKMNLREMLGE